MKLNLEPVANILVRANDAFVAFEGLLIAEIAAGNATAGTPMSACGRGVRHRFDSSAHAHLTEVVGAHVSGRDF